MPNATAPSVSSSLSKGMAWRGRQRSPGLFELTAQDEADLRWYLEDYLQWPHDPAPKIAARVEDRMQELGTELFRSIFQADDDTRELWSAVRRVLPTRGSRL